MKGFYDRQCRLAACLDCAFFLQPPFCFWLPKTLVGSKGCATGYAVFIEDSVGRVLIRIPCPEVWLLPAEEGEMGYQPNFFFFRCQSHASPLQFVCWAVGLKCWLV